jgi:hypothetical protein
MMLDDLRNAADSSFFEEDPLEQKPERPQRRQRQGDILGMSAGQRFVIALFLFFMVAILGAFLLIVYQKISIPV